MNKEKIIKEKLIELNLENAISIFESRKKQNGPLYVNFIYDVVNADWEKTKNPGEIILPLISVNSPTEATEKILELLSSSMKGFFETMMGIKVEENIFGRKFVNPIKPMETKTKKDRKKLVKDISDAEEKEEREYNEMIQKFKKQSFKDKAKFLMESARTLKAFSSESEERNILDKIIDLHEFHLKYFNEILMIEVTSLLRNDHHTKCDCPLRKFNILLDSINPTEVGNKYQILRMQRNREKFNRE